MDELGEHTWILKITDFKIIDFKIRHRMQHLVCISDFFENSMDVLRSIRGCVDGRDAVWRLIWACVCQRPNLFSQQFGRFFVSSGKSPIMLKPIEITSLELEHGTYFLKICAHIHIH